MNPFRWIANMFRSDRYKQGPAWYVGPWLEKFIEAGYQTPCRAVLIRRMNGQILEFYCIASLGHAEGHDWHVSRVHLLPKSNEERP